MAASLVSASGILVDSDVLIWALRGNPRAVLALQGKAEWYLSAVSYMELAQGCRNKTELKALQKAFKAGDNDVLPLTPAISDLACSLVEKYALSHSLHMADALIAATAISHALPLLTGNGKHFGAVDGLSVQVFSP